MYVLIHIYEYEKGAISNINYYYYEYVCLVGMYVLCMYVCVYLFICLSIYSCIYACTIFYCSFFPGTWIFCHYHVNSLSCPLQRKGFIVPPFKDSSPQIIHSFVIFPVIYFLVFPLVISQKIISVHHYHSTKPSEGTKLHLIN